MNKKIWLILLSLILIFAACDKKVEEIEEMGESTEEVEDNEKLKGDKEEIEEISKEKTEEAEDLDKDNEETKNSDKKEIEDEKIVEADNIKENLEEEKLIALTFDDGPMGNSTSRVLEILSEYDSFGTFFVLGQEVEEYPDTAKMIVDQGSEIGNHSYSHKNLTKLSKEALEAEIKLTDKAVKKATGITPKLIRPTYGAFDENLQENVDKPLILWNRDTLDWESRDPQKIVDHVLETAEDGDIILMHDVYDETADAVLQMVPLLVEKGFKMVTVSDLIKARGGDVLPGDLIFSYNLENEEGGKK